MIQAVTRSVSHWAWGWVLLACAAQGGMALAADAPPDGLREDMTRAHGQPARPAPPEHQAEVVRAMAIGTRLHAAWQSKATPQPALARAIETALATEVDRCDRMVYQAIGLPPEAPDPRSLTVYLLASMNDASIGVAGRHHRVELSPDGGRVLATTASTKGCIVAGSGQASEFLFVHPRNCTPNEYHVYLSLRHRRTVNVSTSVGNWRIEAGRIGFISERAAPCLDSSLALLEGRWVMYGPASRSDGSLAYGLLYFDPTAGPSLRAGGRFTRDGDGRHVPVLSGTPVLPPDVPLTVRLQANQPAAALSEQAIAELGLDARPAWLAVFADPDGPVLHAMKWGHFLNGTGDSETALAHLLPAHAKQPLLPELAFELGFAHNALQHYRQARDVLQPALAQSPKQPWLCKELGYSLLKLHQPAEAAAVYRPCFALADDLPADTRSELALHLAMALGQLGQRDECQQWRNKALEVSPLFSPLHQTLSDPRWADVPCVQP